MTGIVIVTYNSEDELGACLDACLSLNQVAVVVVDNNSADSSVGVARSRPGVQVIANGSNRGFAGAVNQGIASLDCSNVLLLNPDAIPLTPLEPLSAALRGPGVGAAAGQLLSRDGTPQHGFNVRRLPTPLALVFEVVGLNWMWPSNPVNRNFRQVLNGPADVEQPAAAFLMVSRTAWNALGGFDEAFHPLWFEDVDFCKRLQDSGYRIAYDPAAQARHAGAHSAGRLSWADRQKYWYSSLMRYAVKHFAPGQARLVCLAVLAACLPRMLVALVTNLNLIPVSVYSRVIWSASLYLFTGRAGERGEVRKAVESSAKSGREERTQSHNRQM